MKLKSIFLSIDLVPSGNFAFGSNNLKRDSQSDRRGSHQLIENALVDVVEGHDDGLFDPPVASLLAGAADVDQFGAEPRPDARFQRRRRRQPRRHCRRQPVASVARRRRRRRGQQRDWNQPGFNVKQKNTPLTRLQVKKNFFSKKENT